MINLAIFYCINDFFFPLHCKDIAYRLILFPSLLPIAASPVIAVHCWWGESSSYVLSLLKSFLMEWKAYILFPNEAQCPTSSEHKLPCAAWSCWTPTGLVPLYAVFLLWILTLGKTWSSQRLLLVALEAFKPQPHHVSCFSAFVGWVRTETFKWWHTSLWIYLMGYR